MLNAQVTLTSANDTWYLRGFVNNVKDMLSGSRDHEKRTVLWMLIVSAVLVAIAVEDLEWVEEGLKVRLRRSKADQEGEGLARTMGVTTVALISFPGDVAHTPLPTLQRAVGAAMGSQLHRLAWGHDRRTVTARRGTDEPDKTMGAQETFGRDTDDREVILRELLRLSHRVTGRMRTAVAEAPVVVQPPPKSGTVTTVMPSTAPPAARAV